MRLHRLIAILLLMESRRLVKARELATALETSERTIYRDIDTLCEAGIPIAADTGPSGGFSLMEGYTINTKHLHGDDVISLYLSGIGIRPDKFSEANLNLKKSLLKLEKSLPAQYLPDIRIAKERFFFDPDQWWKEPQPLRHLDLLRRAVWQSLKLQIRYTKSSMNITETTDRKIRPYGLVVKNMEWYLAAYCETRQELRIFRCERIIEAVVFPDESFSIPSDFTLEVFWRDRVNEFKDIVRKSCSPNYPVCMRILDQDLNILSGLEIASQPSDPESDIVTINLYSYDNACSKILEFGEKIEVLAPVELRNYVIKKTENMLKIYMSN